MTSIPAIKEKNYNNIIIKPRKSHLRLIKPSQNQITPPYDKMKVSEEIYWEHYYEYPDGHFEWKNGFLEEIPVGDFKNIRLAAWLDFVIKCFLHTNPIAKIIQLEFAFRMIFINRNIYSKT